MISKKVSELSEFVINWYLNHPKATTASRIGYVKEFVDDLKEKIINSKISVEEFERLLMKRYPLPFSDPEYKTFN